MNNKLVLTSAVVFGFMCPAVATPSHTSNTFPSNGLMEADYTYTGQATYDNIGAYGGDVVAEAEYEFIDYNLGPGQYLPQSSTTITQCTTGNFCTGIGDVHYDTTTDQGITACSTVGDHSYTLSDLGSSAASDCYRNCASGDVANLKSGGTMTGRVFSNNVNTCGPSDANQCANGYHYVAGTAGVDLTTAIGVTQAGQTYGAVSNSGDDINNNASTYGLNTTNDHNAFVVDYGNGKKVSGHGRCSTQSGTANNDTWSAPTIINNLTDETGQTGAHYCYCQLDGYTLTNGSMQNLSGPWVFGTDLSTEYMCSLCAGMCATLLNRSDFIAFRAAVFDEYQTPSSPAMCDANTITINWTGATAEAISANNAGTATYGGDIRTPQSATPVPGKTFKGWRFSAPAQSGSGS